MVEQVKETIIEHKKIHKEERFNTNIVKEYFTGKNKKVYRTPKV